MRIGTRGHDFGRHSPEKLAGLIAAHGFTSMQLALEKAIDGYVGGPDKLNPGLASYIGGVFRERGVQIAVMGCYFNPVHPDPAERRSGIAKFKNHLRFARDFGCSVVGTETGSFNADYSDHPDNHTAAGFNRLVESLEEMADEARNDGVIAAIEGVYKYVADTPETVRRLIDTVGSNSLQVILDPVNFLTPDNYRDQEKIIARSFELFGDRIVALHMKDFVCENGEIQSRQIGKGILNYNLLFKYAKEYKPYLNLLIEELNPAESERIIAHLTPIYENA